MSSLSQNSSSDSHGGKRPPSTADLKQMIHLQASEGQAATQKQDSQSRVQGLLEPAFKEGYSLMFGT